MPLCSAQPFHERLTMYEYEVFFLIFSVVFFLMSLFIITVTRCSCKALLLLSNGHKKRSCYTKQCSQRESSPLTKQPSWLKKISLLKVIHKNVFFSYQKQLRSFIHFYSLKSAAFSCE